MTGARPTEPLKPRFNPRARAREVWGPEPPQLVDLRCAFYFEEIGLAVVFLSPLRRLSPALEGAKPDLEKDRTLNDLVQGIDELSCTWPSGADNPCDSGLELCLFVSPAEGCLFVQWRGEFVSGAAAQKVTWAKQAHLAWRLCCTWHAIGVDVLTQHPAQNYFAETPRDTGDPVLYAICMNIMTVMTRHLRAARL